MIAQITDEQIVGGEAQFAFIFLTAFFGDDIDDAGQRLTYSALNVPVTTESS
jgi:hypothetical protein